MSEPDTGIEPATFYHQGKQPCGNCATIELIRQIFTALFGHLLLVCLELACRSLILIGWVISFDRLLTGDLSICDHPFMVVSCITDLPIFNSFQYVKEHCVVWWRWQESNLHFRVLPLKYTPQICRGISPLRIQKKIVNHMNSGHFNTCAASGRSKCFYFFKCLCYGSGVRSWLTLT